MNTGKAPGEIAVLCRTATDFAQIQAALVARDVPVEVVGLSGLLHLPEIADLVAVCEVLQDPGANASLVRLLTGPRWRIGPRDLALLGRRARRLVSHARVDGDDDPDRRLAEAVEGVDPAEVISLADALDTSWRPRWRAAGTTTGCPSSPDARVRFARLAAELRDLRRSLADPLMDVLHRVLAVTGLEVELSASPHALAARRRETLSNFLDIAASFAAGDNEATLLAFLGFLRTAAQYEKGLDNALPGGENTVKVLTAHKSKGLEWDVVAVPGLVTGAFPSDRGREKWTAQAKALPHALRGDAGTLPDVPSWDSRGLKAFHEAMKEHQHTEELRLGYVTFTRPRSLLLGSGHWWGPSQKKPRGPSEFLLALHDHCAAGYGEIEAWADEPEEDEENPALRQAGDVQAWPLPLDDAALARRRAAAATVLAHLDRIAADPHGAAPVHDPDAHDDPDWPPPPDDEEPSRRTSPKTCTPKTPTPRTRTPKTRTRDSRSPTSPAHRRPTPPTSAPTAGTPGPPSAPPSRTRRPPRTRPHTPGGTSPRPPKRGSPPRRPAPSPPGTATWTPSPVSCCAPATRSPRSGCPPPSPRPSCCGSPTTPTASPGSWPAPCRARPSPPPAGAPASTRGSRRASRSSPCPCSTPTSCRAPTPRSPTSATWRS